MNQYTIEEIQVGMEESFSVTISNEMMKNFLKITEDINPLHQDDSFAKAHGFTNRVVYGMLTASFLSTLAGVYLPGKNSIIYGIKIDFSKPVYIGDRLLFSGKVVEIYENLGCFIIKVTVTNQDKVKVCRAKMKLGVLK